MKFIPRHEFCFEDMRLASSTRHSALFALSSADAKDTADYFDLAVSFLIYCFVIKAASRVKQSAITAKLPRTTFNPAEQKRFFPRSVRHSIEYYNCINERAEWRTCFDSRTIVVNNAMRGAIVDDFKFYSLSFIRIDLMTSRV